MPSSARAAPSTALAARSRAGRGTLALVVGARTAWARPRQPRAADNRPRSRSCKLRCRLRSLVRDGVALALSAFSKITVFPLSPSPVVGTSEHGCLGCKTSHACARNTKQMRRQTQTACDAVSSAGFCLGRSAVTVSQGTFGVWSHHLRPHPACLIPPSAGLRHSRHRRMRTRRTRVTSQRRRTAKKDASVVEVSPKVLERPEQLLLLKAVLGVPMHVRPGLCHERAPPVDLGHLRKMPGS